MRFFTDILNDSLIIQKIQDIGLPLDYLENENNWVSINYAQEFNKVLLAHFPSKDIHYEVGSYTVSKSGLGGALFSLARNVFNLKHIYSNIWKFHDHFNKLIHIEKVSEGKNEIALKIYPNMADLNESEVSALKFCFPFIISNTIGAYECLPLIKEIGRIKIQKSGDLYSCILDIKYPVDTKSPLFKKYVLACLLINGTVLSQLELASVNIATAFSLVALNLLFYSGYKIVSYKSIVDAAEENLKKIDEQYKDLYDAKVIVQRKFQEEQAINLITSNLIKSGSENEILNNVCYSLKSILNFDRVVIYLADSKNQTLSYATGLLSDDQFSKLIKGIKFDLNINDEDPRKISNIFKLRKGLVVQDLGNHSQSFSEEGRMLLQHSKSKSFLVVPIYSENQSLGVLFVDRLDSSRMLDNDDLNVLQTIACQLAVTIEKIRSTENLSIAYAETKSLADSYSRFVPWESLKMLNYNSIHDVKLGDGIEKTMSILFSDIRGFSTLSEAMKPNEILKFLNAYFARFSPIIKKYNGTIDKFLGDGVMARFANPQDSVAAAIEIQRELYKYNQERSLGGRELISAGIGIATGQVVTGPLGFDGRMEITVISDNVNKASRIEGLCGTLGAKILICSETEKFAILPASCVKSIIRDVTVKGREELFDIYEIKDHLILSQSISKTSA